MPPIPTSNTPQNCLPKEQLKQLQDQKGALSRRIGECKKAGLSCDDLIVEMQFLTNEIKKLSTTSTRIKNTHPSLAAVKANTLPAHFTPHTQPKDNSPISGLVIRQLTNSDDKHKWNAFVEQQNTACIYHRYEFKNIVEQSFGHNTAYYMALDLAHNVVGILPTVFTQSRLFGSYITSLPYFNYGGCLAINDEIETALVNAASKDAQQQHANYLELRESKHREEFACRNDKISMILELPDNSETLWQNLGTKVRAQIKKGEEHLFTFKFGKEELLNDFYQVFSTNMRDLGTPVYAKQFFHTLLTQMPHNSTLALLYYKNKPVSGGFLLGFRDTLEIPWASTLKSANHLNANMVFYWQVLQFAIQKKYTFFDFGRSSKDAPTYRFKKQWGSKEVQLYWSYPVLANNELPSLNPNSSKYQLAIRVWQKLPLFISNVLGPHIVKNLP